MSCLTSVGKGIVFRNVFQFMTSADRLFYNCVYRGNMVLFLYTRGIPHGTQRGFEQRRKLGEKYAESSFDHGRMEAPVYLCLAGRYFTADKRVQ